MKNPLPPKIIIGVVMMKSHTPAVNHGRNENGTHVRTVAPAARPRNKPALKIARARTPVRAIVTLLFIDFNSASGASNVLTQVSLQK